MKQIERQIMCASIVFKAIGMRAAVTAIREADCEDMARIVDLGNLVADAEHELRCAYREAASLTDWAPVLLAYRLLNPALRDAARAVTLRTGERRALQLSADARQAAEACRGWFA